MTLKGLIASLLCLVTVANNYQTGYGQEFNIDALPRPGSMISTTPAYVPLTLKGMIVHPENVMNFDFLMDTGDSHLKGQELSGEALKMMKYFLAALTIPEKDLWVNLSPYEKDRIVQESFGQTVMGRDLLAEDYVLKQLTSSLIYPEKALGKEFWRQVYSKASQEYGTTAMPVNTFNKVWIVPSKAVVWEHQGKVFIVNSHLKVMLEEDYLSMKNGFIKDPRRVHSLASNVVRTIVLPVLEKEVNEGKNFAQLRQMYQAMILATWYKKALRQSILNKVYADQRRTAGIRYMDQVVIDKAKQNDVELIYQQYLRAFKKGAFNYIKEDIDPLTGYSVPRKYFSGGFSLDEAMTVKGRTSFYFSTMVLTILAGELPSLSLAQQRDITKMTGTMIEVKGVINEDLDDRPVGKVKTALMMPLKIDQEKIRAEARRQIVVVSQQEKPWEIPLSNFWKKFFIVSLGFLIGAIPAAVLYLIARFQIKDWGEAALIIAGYIALNVAFGNFIVVFIIVPFYLLDDVAHENGINDVWGLPVEFLIYLGFATSIVIAGTLEIYNYFFPYKLNTKKALIRKLESSLSGRDYTKFNRISDELHRRGYEEGNVVFQNNRMVRRVDPAMSTELPVKDLHHLGGISLDAGMMALEINRDDKAMIFPLSQESFRSVNIFGFIPRIISIQSINFAAFLGLTK